MLLVEETDRRLQRKLYTVPMVDEITFDASRFLGMWLTRFASTASG